jgi:hypothetical protein
MEGNVVFRRLKEVRDLKLGEPNRATLEAQIDPDFAIRGGVEDEFAAHEWMC